MMASRWWDGGKGMGGGPDGWHGNEDSDRDDVRARTAESMGRA
jgi:hypothetical protein